MLDNLFFSKKPQKKLPFTERELLNVIKRNRNSLSQISDWIDKDAFSNSYFNYGVPDYIFKDINRSIDNSLTYSDVLVYVANKYFEKVNYLELGVSVGKNFHQMINSDSHIETAVGFDIENINPVLLEQLCYKCSEEWKTPLGSLKKNNSSLTTYTHNNSKTKINYLSADIWDDNSWQKLEGQKFDIIFSDALHTPEAILFEFEMIVKYGLLADDFFILWDDIVSITKMDVAFKKIYKKYNKQFGVKDYYLCSLNGWLGEHEMPHSIGVISNLGFSK